MQRKQLSPKEISVINEIKDNTLIAATAIDNGYGLVLQRNQKREDKLQLFTIIRVNDEEIQRKIEEEFNKWRSQISGSIKKREVDKSKQNIILNELLKAMKERNIVEYTNGKKSEKFCSRLRLTSINNISLQHWRDVYSEKLNAYFVSKIPVRSDQLRKDCLQTINSLGEFTGCLNSEKMMQQNEEIYKIVSSEMNVNTQNGSVSNGIDELQQIEDQEQTRVTQTLITETCIEENPNGISCMSQQVYQFQNANGEINYYILIGQNAIPCFIYNHTIYGNIPIVIRKNDEDNSIHYYTIVYTTELNSYSFVQMDIIAATE